MGMVKEKWPEETEGLVMAAQEQALRTRHIRKVIDKENISPVCRLSGERDEPVAHILTECKTMAEKQYIKVGGMIKLPRWYIGKLARSMELIYQITGMTTR